MANPEDLGRFRLKRLLGRGVLGEVWEAIDVEEHGNKVCVKIMHAADDELALARSQFAREGRLASLMRHPNVATVYDAGEAAGTSFLVMDMVEGRSLRALLRGKDLEPPATLTEKLTWLAQIAEGVQALHRAGVVHRDLKPANVIIRPDRTACLVDLGISKWTKFDLGGVIPGPDEGEDANDIESAFERDMPAPKSSPTSDAEGKDAAAYVPPETPEGELYDELGDQYAWGVLAYELLTGSPPGPGSSPLEARADVNAPLAVKGAIDRARARDRDARFDTMERLIAKLTDKPAPEAPRQRAQAIHAIETPLPAPPEALAAPTAESRPKGNPLVIVGVVLALAALAVAAVVALR